jgi:phosphatidylglycerophosphate synthase
LHNFVDKYFSKKYVNNQAVLYNPIMIFLYRISFPLSILFNYLKIKPNTISFFSLFFCLISAFFILKNNSFFFALFWSLSILLDFCDGTVARLSNYRSNFRFNLDHYLDLIKITLIVLIFSIEYNDKSIWIISCLFIFLMFFNEVVSFDLSKISSNFLITEVKSYNFLFIVYKSLYTIFFTFNAHTLFIFLIINLNPTFAKYVMAYLVSLLFKNLSLNLYNLLKKI